MRDPIPRSARFAFALLFFVFGFVTLLGLSTMSLAESEASPAEDLGWAFILGLAAVFVGGLLFPGSLRER